VNDGTQGIRVIASDGSTRHRVTLVLCIASTHGEVVVGHVIMYLRPFIDVVRFLDDVSSLASQNSQADSDSEGRSRSAFPSGVFLLSPSIFLNTTSSSQLDRPLSL